MALLKSYKKINAFIQNESYEPMAAWGIRMAVAGTVPILWGLATGKLDDAIWVTLTAEAISWVELKGSFNWRVRTLFIGAVLALFWGVIGTITGYSIWLSILMMFVAGFVATLLKDLGDRASGLAICVYLMFIICNAFPDNDIPDIEHRIRLIAVGTAWPIIVGLTASLFMPVQQPFRRQIAIIWRSIATLIETLSRSGVDKKAQEDLYLKENEVRAAIDKSFEFYGKMAHQGNRKDNRQYQLLQLRKNAALTAVNIIAMADEMGHIAVGNLDEGLRVKAATMFSALKEAISRLSVYILTLKTEEKLLAYTQISRVKKLTVLINEYPLTDGTKETLAIKRILQLTGRTVKLLESALDRITQMGQDIPVYRSHSLIKTIFLLRPRKMASNVKSLLNFNALTVRYALRSAIAACIGLLIAKVFHLRHGYWIPFSLMIVIQPYFGATLKKAIERVAGTLLGGLAGGLFLLIPSGLHVKEAVMFITFVMMVYYVRKNYSIAVFVVTINLVLLFSIEKDYDKWILLERALCTVGGSLLAVISGILLLPAWDKKWLPHHMGTAIKSNFEYFLITFYPPLKTTNWTRYKRIAESQNSILFDSFNRYMQEPGKQKVEDFYDTITCNVRITRDMNTINMELDESTGGAMRTLSPFQQRRINECRQLMNEIVVLAQPLNPVLEQLTAIDETLEPIQQLNEAQAVALHKLWIELSSLRDDLKVLNLKEG